MNKMDHLSTPGWNPASNSLINSSEGNNVSLVKMASMTLQGFLMLSEGAVGIPFIAMEISDCFRQIIWSPTDPATGLLCSRLAPSVRKDLRDVLLMVARGELLDILNRAQISQLVSLVKASIGAVTSATPLTVADVEHFLASVADGIKNLTDYSKRDTEQESSWNFVKYIVTEFTSNEVKHLVVDVLLKIQGRMHFALIIQ
jgi:hypothetical protein